SDECGDEQFCNDDGQCVAAEDDGAACTAAEQCKSGNCVDDVCCDTACDGECSACSEAAGASKDGTCEAAVVKGAEDAGTCDANNGSCANQPCTCDDQGACLGATGATCSGGTDCASGSCTNDSC